MVSAAKQKLIIALDFDRLEPAAALARELRGLAGWYKIGKQLFTAEGPRAVEAVASIGASIFLDLKFHDIPNTVAQAVRAAAALPGVKLLNVHAAGGSAMLRAASEVLRGLADAPSLLAVTVLTSMDARALREVGMAGPPARQVLRLARLAQRCKLDGVVASPQEIRSLRRACGTKFLIVTPGVRPAGSARGDQRRTATPAEALRAGADYLVVGRPVTAAQDPAAAAARIAAEMDAALR